MSAGILHREKERFLTRSSRATRNRKILLNRINKYTFSAFVVIQASLNVKGGSRIVRHVHLAKNGWSKIARAADGTTLAAAAVFYRIGWNQACCD
jgi:hypothetical protein